VGKTQRGRGVSKNGMPTLSGFELRRTKKSQQIPILVLESENVDIKITGQKSGKKSRWL
jgi:hypothetical protein